MLAGLVLFAVGLIIGGTAPDMLVLVAGRAGRAWARGRASSGLRGDLPVLCRGVPAENVRRALHRVGGARPDRPAVAALVAAAVGWRWVFLVRRRRRSRLGRWSCWPCGTSRLPRARERLLCRPGRARRGGPRRDGARGDQFRRRARGRRGRCRLRRPSRALHAPADTTPASTAPPGLTVTILTRSLLTCCFFAGDAYVPYAIVTVRHSPTVAGSACADSVAPYLDGRIVGAGPLHSPVGAAPSGPAGSRRSRLASAQCA